MNLSRTYPARKCPECGKNMHFPPDAKECAECEIRARVKWKDSVRRVGARMGEAFNGRKPSGIV